MDRGGFPRMKTMAGAVLLLGSLADLSNAGGDPQPVLSINDQAVVEGGTGAITMTFTVILSVASAQQITVAFATANGMATSPVDYAAASGTLTFDPGETSQLLPIQVNGDASVEANETFVVNLSNPTHATIADGQGRGTIANDDGVGLTLSIGDAAIVEGDSGEMLANFTVTLSSTPSQFVTVDYSTTNGTATAPDDYTVTSGTLMFIPGGQITQQRTVPVKGDVSSESTEAFYVILSNAVNAGLSDPQGQGTITDNDAPLDVGEHVSGNDGIGLAAPFPNPSPHGISTVITLPMAAQARLDVHDLHGRVVQVLIEGPLAAGRHPVRWEGFDPRQARVPAGLYFLRLSVNDAIARRQRMILLR